MTTGPHATPIRCAQAMPGRARRQRGAALLVAMILVTVVSTLAAGMVWQQWRAVEVEAAERSRTQSAWILNGALDWARLILREDARTGTVDHLGEPWAVPLAEARLSTFLAAERSENADDAPEAFLSGDIADAQSRFNLRNLIDGEGKVDKAQLLVLQRLMASAGLSSGLADQVANGLRQALANPPEAQAPLAPRGIDQLGWLGVDEAARAKLAPWIVLLPVASTKINLNTAPREVLAAVIGVDVGSAQRLVQTREQRPFNEVGDAQQLLPTTGNPAPKFDGTGVSSNYFEVHGRLRLGTQVLEERSLVRRDQREVVAILRERVSSTLMQAGTVTPTR
jgi:general secretion pathway protein K